MRIWIISLLISPSAHALKVMIDAGHGGSDSGAYSQGIKESDITLKVAQKLAQLLGDTADFHFVMSRSEDVNMDLESRVRKAHEEKVDLFLSIHANASTDPKASGAEFYFQNQLAPDQISEFLSHHESQASATKWTTENSALNLSQFPADVRHVFHDLLDRHRIRSSFELSKSLRENWQGQKKAKEKSLKQAPFQVVSRTSIPSSLVEIGFLTNIRDLRELKTEEYLNRVATSLYTGLVSYKKTLK